MTRSLYPAGVLALTLLLPAAAGAEMKHVDLAVHGMDCATCAFSVRMSVGKIDGVERVELRLERAAAEITLRPANRVTLAQLRQTIKTTGYEAKAATVTVLGTLVDREGKPALQVAQLDQTWTIERDPAHAAAYDDTVRRVASKSATVVEIVGVVPPPAAGQPERLAIRSVR
jgi:cation transport ATPase